MSALKRLGGRYRDRVSPAEEISAAGHPVPLGAVRFAVCWAFGLIHWIRSEARFLAGVDILSAVDAIPPGPADSLGKVVVVQMGARLHYALPIALHRHGLLERLYCEWYSRPGSLDRAIAIVLKRLKPQLGTRMLDRYDPALDSADVRSHPLVTYRIMRSRSRFPTQRAFYSFENEERAAWIAKRGFGGARSLFGYVRSIAPRLLTEARRCGLATIADQFIAPAAIELEEDTLQRQRYPDWVLPSDDPDHAGASRDEEETWSALDHITCASDYVRHGLIRQGIADNRITVNPYPLDATHFPFVDRAQRSDGPLVVGFVGSVSLRKGAPYFLRIAREFDPQKVRFVMVGPVALSSAAISQLKPHVEIVGPVPRSTIPARLEKMDVYLFPSTCEGSAGSIMEAMASGLPVLCSPNSGSVIRHGTDGYILPYDDTGAYVGGISELLASREKRLAMGRAAAERAMQFTLDAYAQRFFPALAAARSVASSRK